MAHQVVTLEVVFQRAEEFDVVHFHIDYLHFPLSRRQPITHVTTFHGRLDIPDLIPLYKEFRGMPVISISNGQREAAAKVLAGLLDASLFFDLHRLPELFCGFPRRPGESPTLYPVACAPQAWASGAVFLLLEACLGLSVLASERRVIFSKPLLPGFLRQVTIRDLKVGEARVDLLLTRHDEGDVGVNVLRRDGEVDIAVLK
jgi:hypothetical protein